MKFYYIFINCYFPKLQVLVNFLFFKVFIPYINLEYNFQNSLFFIYLSYVFTILILIFKLYFSFSFLIDFSFTIYKNICKQKITKKSLIIFTKSIDFKKFVTLNNFIKIYNLFVEIGTVFFFFLKPL